MSLLEKLAHIIGDRKVPVPAMPGISVPRISFGSRATLKIIFFTVLVSLGAVGTGMYFTIRDVVHSSWDWPKAGAEYNLPQTMGTKLEPYEDGTESQTLKINLSDGTRLSSLSMTNVDIGRASTPCVTIERASGNTTGWLYVDTWTITGATAKSADFANMEVANLTLQAYTDGHTMEATLDSTISAIDAQSSRSSGVYLVEDSIVDQIVLVLAGSATVSTLLMADIDCSLGTGWNIDYVKAGAVTIDANSKFGSGSGIDSADFVVNSTVKARTITNQMVDSPITVR